MTRRSLVAFRVWTVILRSCYGDMSNFRRAKKKKKRGLSMSELTKQGARDHRLGLWMYFVMHFYNYESTYIQEARHYSCNMTLTSNVSDTQCSITLRQITTWLGVRQWMRQGSSTLAEVLLTNIYVFLAACTVLIGLKIFSLASPSDIYISNLFMQIVVIVISPCYKQCTYEYRPYSTCILTTGSSLEMNFIF